MSISHFDLQNIGTGDIDDIDNLEFRIMVNDMIDYNQSYTTDRISIDFKN